MKKNECNILTLPYQITDDEIFSLFFGLLDIINKKYELDYKNKIINLTKQNKVLTSKIKILSQQLREKQIEN